MPKGIYKRTEEHKRNVSKSLRGTKHSEGRRKNESEAQGGAKSWRWKGGISSIRVFPPYQIFKNYENRAKKIEIEFNLTKEEFKILIEKDCYYCGAKPNNKSRDYFYNGLDRMDNTKGYTINNVVPCCKHCNIAKNTFTLQEFKDWIEKVYKNFRR